MSDTKELRADAPADLVRALDALALSHDQNRTTYMVAVLEKHVKAELHRVTIVTSMLRGNPLLSDTERSQ
jgi:predicted transcriptional regulator